MVMVVMVVAAVVDSGDHDDGSGGGYDDDAEDDDSSRPVLWWSSNGPIAHRAFRNHLFDRLDHGPQATRLGLLTTPVGQVRQDRRRKMEVKKPRLLGTQEEGKEEILKRKRLNLRRGGRESTAISDSHGSCTSCGRSLTFRRPERTG